MRKLLAVSVAIVLGVFAAGCGDGGKAAAEEGLSSAQAALDAVKAEGTHYAPEIVEDISKSLRAARGTYDSGNFRQALAEVQLLPTKMAALDAAVSAKRAELSKEWSALNTTLPEVVDSIQSRVDVLSKTKRPPAGVSAERFNTARADAEALVKEWSEATDAVTKENLADAVAKAQSVKAKAPGVMAALGMPVPDTLK